MKIHALLLFPIALVSLLASCASTDDERVPVVVDPVPASAWILEPELARFATWLGGSFVAIEDPGTRLNCARVWTARPELWILVELQSRYGSLPPEVEVWRVERRGDSSLRVHVHDLPAPASEFRGAWQNEAPLAAIGPKDLRPRELDGLTLLDHDTSFQGGSAVGAAQRGARALRVVIGAHRVLWQAEGTGAAAGSALSFARVR